MTIRHAPYEDSADFAIGLKPIAEADWFEGGEADPFARKDPLFSAHRQTVFGELPGSEAGQEEVLALVEAARGPTAREGWPALYAAARAVADDLVLMEKRAGAWTVTAISLSAPSFFSVPEVLGRPLDQIHAPVHGFSDRFLSRVVRIFEGLRPGLVLQRRNWTIANSAEPFMPDAVAMRARIDAIEPASAGEELFVRVERQTLRRLPRTGGALFTIRVWLHPLGALAREPERLAAFARAWKSAPPDFRAYKRLAAYDRLIEAFLEAHKCGAQASSSGVRR